MMKNFVFDCSNKNSEFILRLILCFKSFFSFIIGGESCLCCGKKTVLIPLCSDCLAKFSELRHIRCCKICGKELISEIDFCSSCRNSPVLKSPDAVFPLHEYNIWKKNLLFEWKIEGKRNLTPFFAAVIAKKILSIEKEFGEDVPVVPVPPRPGKIRINGWDQVEDLCVYLHKFWNIKIIRILHRSSKIQQKKLNRTQRFENILDSYSLVSEKKLKRIEDKLKIFPKKAFLLDDVLTTGATIEKCSELLKCAGIEKVYGITIFIVE